MMARRFLIATMAVTAGLTATGAAVAAESPRWAIVSTSSPTNLEPNSPRNEVQDVTVNATGGTFTLGVVSIRCSGGAPQLTGPIAYNASAEEVQAALEAVSCDVGSGNVTVSGGPGGSSPYVVTFVGERADERFSSMTTNSASLTGGPATVTATEAVRGAFVPYLTVTAINVGGASTDGSAITLSDVLPAALTARGVFGYDAYASAFVENGEGAAALSCSTPPELTCSYSGTLDPGDMLVMRIPVNVAEPLASNVNEATISGGGGAAEASVSVPIAISDTAATFGPAPGSVLAALSTNQAGAHANVTTAFTMATSETDAVPAQAKDIRFDLPPGLVGNTVGVPQCTMAKVLNLEHEPNGCPSDTMVGMATFTVNTQAGVGGGDGTRVVPVYNITPAPGEPAAFAFDAIKLPVRLDTSVLSDGDYGVRVTAPSLTEAGTSLAAAVTIWGVPADHSGPGQDLSLFTLFGGESFGGSNHSQTRMPLLTNPQQCNEEPAAVFATDSWTNPGSYISSGRVPMGVLTGCDQLSFESSFTMLPDALEAGVPAGYAFDLNVPQDSEPDGLAKPTIKAVRLTLPAGTVISPSAASGLEVCSDTQFFGSERGESEAAKPGSCPDGARIGAVEVRTPALALPLQGHVYLAEPECDPCTPEDAQDGRMIRIFLEVVGEGESGVVVKLEGKGMIDQQTGQITTTFENNPQLPFSELKLRLDGGPRATLANPRTCGTVSSSLDLTPWNTPFGSDSTVAYGFEINQGCFSPQFNPSFVAGTTNIQAGGYSPFTLSLGRGEDDQFLSELEMSTPPGLLGKLSSVVLCKEPRAAEGTCGAESAIGHVQVRTGPGSSPLLVTGGRVFLTESYKGAPFGLSIVVPAVAGPYTLAGTSGKGTVVERATIDVDPTDAHLVIKSDALPTTLDGIPLQLKVVNVTIDRGEFTFNPTNCGKLAVAGTVSSSEGAKAGVSNSFQVANCASLPFKPKFTVLTQAKTSKANGAYLHVKVTSGPGQANIGKVRVDLPRQLPSRLSTLQKACIAAVFEANPANCPAGSVVGTGTAVTPILKSGLVGPAYLVSHGGAAFPDLEIVLQGEGITLILDGKTHISKGITSSTFKVLPDAPISTFDLVLPRGPHSVLAANGNLCGTTLHMPTVITGQNGALVKQTTKIAVSGCTKAKRTKKGGHGRAKAGKK